MMLLLHLLHFWLTNEEVLLQYLTFFFQLFWKAKNMCTRPPRPLKKPASQLWLCFLILVQPKKVQGRRRWVGGWGGGGWVSGSNVKYIKTKQKPNKNGAPIGFELWSMQQDWITTRHKHMCVGCVVCVFVDFVATRCRFQIQWNCSDDLKSFKQYHGLHKTKLDLCLVVSGEREEREKERESTDSSFSLILQNTTQHNKRERKWKIGIEWLVASNTCNLVVGVKLYMCPIE